jgi:hypothetical protein
LSSNNIGGDAGETATLISFESGDLEQATMVSARTAANNARKKRFMGNSPILMNGNTQTLGAHQV